MPFNPCPALKPLFLDKSLTRAQEYTADRTAVYYAEEDALDLIYLYSGKYMGDKVNIDEYFKSIDTHNNSFWLKLNNFLSDHPVGYRRMQALKEAKENGWDVQSKHHTSVEMLKYLFTKEQHGSNAKEKILNYTTWFWDNIENYFMGILPTEVKEKISKIKHLSQF